MEIRFRQGSLLASGAGALVLGVAQDAASRPPELKQVDRLTGGAVARLLASRDFAGGFLDTAVLHPEGLKARRLLLVGLGPGPELDERRVREAAGQAIRRARDLGAGTVALPALGADAIGLERASQLTAEGAVLGHYRFTAYRRGARGPLRRIDVVLPTGAEAAAARASGERGGRWAEAACLARDLANTPGQDLTPGRLADRAREVAKASRARIRVHDVAQLERLGAGALLAVGRGSPHPPCLIVLESAAVSKRTAPIVVIGKGITFDTGGISLKPRENMHRMKYDMSGAAAVLGLFAALPTLAPGLPLVGMIPSAENMPDGAAFKPGDVLRALDGTTIEVTNTDAEGRLVLADALAYARRYEPAAVVDLATLTGAISIALGHHAAGLFTRDDALGVELSEASAASGERVWPMPLWDEVGREIRGDTADLVNSTGSPQGAALVAASFLEHFARGMRWAHLDIASTAWAYSERPLESRGASGFGVRLLLEWLSRRPSEPATGRDAGRASSRARPRARRAGRSPRASSAASSRQRPRTRGRSSTRRRA